jgi:hypothetical protein
VSESVAIDDATGDDASIVGAVWCAVATRGAEPAGDDGVEAVKSVDSLGAAVTVDTGSLDSVVGTVGTLNELAGSAVDDDSELTGPAVTDADVAGTVGEETD